MNHDIGGIEYIVPVGNMLDIDKVDHTAVNKSIEYVAGAATDYETEADVFVAHYRWAKPEIDANAQQKRDTDHRENSTHALQHAEHAAVVANMGEVNQAVQFYGGILRDSAVHPVANKLRYG